MAKGPGRLSQELLGSTPRMGLDMPPDRASKEVQGDLYRMLGDTFWDKRALLCTSWLHSENRSCVDKSRQRSSRCINVVPYFKQNAQKTVGKTQKVSLLPGVVALCSTFKFRTFSWTTGKEGDIQEQRRQTTILVKVLLSLGALVLGFLHFGNRAD